MANLTTTEDLVVECERIVDGKVDGTSEFRSTILAYMNRAHRAIASGGSELNTELNQVGRVLRDPIAFYWARAKHPHVFNFEAPIEIGTVTATNNSTSITFSSAPAASVANWHIRFEGDNEVYRITAHTGGNTAATLDAAYVNETGSKNYTCFKLIYDLTPSGGILCPLAPIQTFNAALYNAPNCNIDLMSQKAVTANFSLRDVCERMPDMGAIIGNDETTLSILFNGYPGDLERAEMPYIPVPATLSVGGNNPIIPVSKRLILVELTAFYILRSNNDDRAEKHLMTAAAMWDDLVYDNERISRGSNFRFAKVYPNPHAGFNRKKMIRTPSGYIG